MTRDEAIKWLREEVQHYDCEDCWYSCSKLTCDDERHSDKCDCGADEQNAKRAEIAAMLERTLGDEERPMSDIDGLIEACRIHAAHNYTSPDAASVLRRAADALASERGRVGEHDTELAEWRRMAASPHDLEVAKTCWLQDKFAAERKVAGLEAQVALDTGNIERMREAGEKAERKVDRLREALDSLLAEEKGIAYLFKIAGSIPPDSFTDACMQARAALAEDGAVQSAMALKCEWKQDDDGIYHTGCGEAFTFDSGTATENKAKFCQYCGGNLRAVPFAEEGGK